MGTYFDPVVKDARTLAGLQHGHTLETGRRSGMMRIVFGCGGFVKRENGRSSGAGFCQSRDAELSHPSTATSPDFDERVVLSWYVSSANVHFKNTSRRCGREKIHWTVSFGLLNLRACCREETLKLPSVAFSGANSIRFRLPSRRPKLQNPLL